ncbi:MAG: VWA domain-containing protein [Deltaproteobacteria bacterium]|nr:VWA domain-containing protein [Deltaproteobacteria bacterium]
MTTNRRTLTLGAGGIAVAIGALIFMTNACSVLRGTDTTAGDGDEGNRDQEISQQVGEAASAKSPSMVDAAAPRPNAPGTVFAGHRRALGYVVASRVAAQAYDAGQFNTEQYDAIDEEGFLSPSRKPLSTFSIDVDTASYSNVRRILKDGMLPPNGAVRIEELLNYFSYDYPKAEGDLPMSLMSEVSQAPWAPEHQLVMVGLKGVELQQEDIPPRNLTFLLDVSGSMQSPNKLALVVRAMKGLVKTLRQEDHVAIVVYAGASGLVLPSTAGNERNSILEALDRLRAGGSTNGGEGIRLAYKVARKNFDPKGINRVILASDGDFNVGTTNRSELRDLIEEERKSGVFLTILGVGTGNLKDATMEELADHGNGNYAYLDTIAEARKVLIREGGSTLVTVAKDVKIQIEFNPARVAGYRLIGYENRRLQDRDFNDDRKDAGELGAGHSVTALYEVIPHGLDADTGHVDPLRYTLPQADQTSAVDTATARDELLTIKLRYKLPDEDQSRLITRHVAGEATRIADASEDLRFAAAVATFGMLLRESPYGGEASWDLATSLARDALGNDPHGDRAEFLYLLSEAHELTDGMGS